MVVKYPDDNYITSIVFSLGVLLRKSANLTFRRKFALNPSEWGIVALLCTAGPLTIGVICERMGRDKAQISRDIAALTRRELICGRRDSADRRRILIDFTESARPTVRALRATLQKRAEQFTAGLNSREQAELRRMLLILVRNARDMHSQD